MFMAPVGSNLKTPLAAYPLLQASDPESLVQALERAYGVREVDVGEGDAPFHAMANRVQLGSVTLHYCRYDTPTRIDFGVLAGFRQFLCLNGAGEIHVDGRGAPVTPDTTAVISPGRDFSASYGNLYSHLVVQISEDEVRRKAELLFGTSTGSHFEAPSMSPAAGDGVNRLKAVALALALQFSNETGGGDVVRFELEQALVSAFLFENRTVLIGPSGLRPRPAGRVDVSRLEDQIQANWDRPLLIEDVAEACGVSVRSVFEGFKQDRGVSPLTYIRNVRLDHARRLLMDDQSQLSVMDVGLRCGFASFGHFAKRYRDRFGELPSATLKRRA